MFNGTKYIYRFFVEKPKPKLYFKWSFNKFVSMRQDNKEAKKELQVSLYNKILTDFGPQYAKKYGLNKVMGQLDFIGDESGDNMV